MTTHQNGFKLEVTMDDGTARVRVSLESGVVVVDTNALSLTGLEKLPAVLETAVAIARDQYEHYYLTQYERRHDRPAVPRED